MDWRDRIHECFRPDDLLFAGSPDEAAAAVELRAEVIRTGIPLAIVEDAIADWLHKETSNTGQLFDQMARVRDFFDV